MSIPQQHRQSLCSVKSNTEDIKRPSRKPKKSCTANDKKKEGKRKIEDNNTVDLNAKSAGLCQSDLFAESINSVEKEPSIVCGIHIRLGDNNFTNENKVIEERQQQKG
jgi:hypothetical protein